MTARKCAALLAVPLAVALSAGTALTQSTCSASAGAAVRVTSRHWPAPLDRQITLEGNNVTLRDGLTRLASAANVRLSYVAELLPLDRAVCMAYRSVAAGEILTDLLRGTELEPVVAGDDQVVLAPARRTTDATGGDDAIASRASVLDRVVVTATTPQTTQRSTPIALDVVSGDRLARLQSGSLSQLLDGSVPGVWMWQQAPATLLARYGSVRGASSFGLSYPKIYIDGIEVANPLIVRQFDPSTVERVEVIRGPQGSALYGADANSGVINIITRHDGTAVGGQRLELQSTAGVSGSQFAPQGVLTQQHGLAFRTGTPERSAGLGVSVGTLGAYVPGAFARTIAANGDMRLVGSRSVLTGIARVSSERAGTPANPLLPRITSLPGGGYQQRNRPPGDQPSYERLGSPFLNDTSRTQSVSQYTLGGTLAFVPNDRWSHTFVLGVDGYRLANPAFNDGPLPSATDSALAAARGGGDRVTARVTSVARFGSVANMATALTFTAEQSAIREQSTIASMMVGQDPGYGDDHGGGNANVGEAPLVGWRGNSGLVAQASTSLRNRYFLTAGVRLERDDALVGAAHVTSLPMVGGAVVTDHGDVTLKLRAAYGMGIRPVQGAIRELAWSGRRTALVAYNLAPEQQSGTEAGADLFVGRTLGFHVTRFDQMATGLIQSVAVTVPARSMSPGPRSESQPQPAGSEVAYQLQNVGAIANRGWEFQGTATFGRLSLASAISLVDSRVERLASGYTGDLRTGDRMLDVPARTTSVTGSWTAARWLGSLTLSRAGDWTGYDRVAIANALTSGGNDVGDLVGDRLRGYWRDYSGVTRVRASFTRDLFRGLSLVLAGENLLGQQRGEPDNVTVVPGRTVTAGVKAKF